VRIRGGKICGRGSGGGSTISRERRGQDGGGGEKRHEPKAAAPTLVPPRSPEGRDGVGDRLERASKRHVGAHGSDAGGRIVGEPRDAAERRPLDLELLPEQPSATRPTRS
jgi:hypothetical protein